MKALAIALLPLLLLPACKPDAQPPSGTPPPPPPKEQVADPAEADSYIGMTVEEAGARADKAKIAWRIVEEDGQSKPVTKDHRPDRLNFAVAKGKIIRVTKG